MYFLSCEEIKTFYLFIYLFIYLYPFSDFQTKISCANNKDREDAHMIFFSETQVNIWEEIYFPVDHV